MNDALDFSEYASPTLEDWKKNVQKELKDNPFESIVWQDENGLVIEPYLTSYQPKFDVPKTASASWAICQSFAGSDPKTLNKNIIEALQGGIQGIRIEAFISSFDDMKTVLQNVMIEILEIHFTASSTVNAVELSTWYSLIAVERKLDSRKLAGSIQQRGNDFINEHPNLLSLARISKENFGLFRPFVINTAEIHNKGANATQEIAYAASAGNELVHHLHEAGFNMDEISAMVLFSFSTGTSYFIELSKLRAFRSIWSTIADQYEMKHNCSRLCNIATWNSSLLQSTNDPLNNMLRATTEAMSAALGGAGSIGIHFSEEVMKNYQSISARMGRNILHILNEESYFTEAKDAAEGTYYVSQVTDQLVEKAWSLFVETENAGGFFSSQASFSKMAEENHVVREEKMKEGKRVMLGVNKYLPK